MLTFEQIEMYLYVVSVKLWNDKINDKIYTYECYYFSFILSQRRIFPFAIQLSFSVN
jgi:hypothetical protein